jgi:hypothetical protein
MQDLFNGWTVDKVFTEIRFSSTPLFFNKKQEILQRLLSDLPNYDIQNMDTLNMHSREFPGKELTLMPNRYAYTFETLSPGDNFSENCKEKWSIINSKLNINQIERFGVRCVFVKEMDIKAASNYSANFLDLTKIRNSINLNAVDYVFVFKEMDKSIRIAANAGEIQSISVVGNVPQASYRQLKGFIVDIDFSVENIQTKFISNLYEESIDKFKKYISMFE